MTTQHLIDRAKERYGLDLSDADCRAIAAMCANKSCRLAVLADGKERHLVMIRGVAMRVIFAPATSGVITALPPTNNHLRAVTLRSPKRKRILQQESRYKERRI